MASKSVYNEGTNNVTTDMCSRVIVDSGLNQTEHEHLKSVNCIETNGDIKHDVCNFLPNNNVCENIDLSHCNNVSDCKSSNLRTRVMLSSQNTSSSSPIGESTSPSLSSQESDTHSQHYTDDEIIQKNESINQVQPPSLMVNYEGSQRAIENLQNQKEIQYNPVVDFSNGALKKTNHKVNKSCSRKKIGLSSTGGRGRPRKTLVAMYHSQISGDKNTIKIRIKKNLTTQVQLTPNKKKSGRRKKHKAPSDTDASSDYETNRKRTKLNVSNDTVVSSTQEQEPEQQSAWGQHIPRQILYKIFQNVCHQEGSLPILVRLCQVCKLWRDVALSPTLWRKIDLNWVREPLRTDIRLHWLIENRLSSCQDLNLGEWKVRDIQTALEALSEHCPELRGINLSGWKGLNADNLKFLTTECEKLERLDLSSINSTSAINAQPLVSLAQTMKGRLTHLVLAHNKLAGFTQIMASIAANCPNLQLLDISNIRTFAHNTALLHVEKIQSGCPILKVLRITNSQIWLAPASIPDQVASPGFPMLEELSLAGIEDDQTTTARSVDDDGIERILKSSTKLRLLDIRGCIRLTDSGLVRVPAWDLEHLFLSACAITRTHSSGMELILQKWSHSLLEVDLAWSTATAPLDAAVLALAEKGSESPLRILNLCGSSVSLDPVKAVLTKCPNLHSINLQSCRALPRGIKRLYTGRAVVELRESFQDKPKTENNESDMDQSAADQSSIQ